MFITVFTDSAILHSQERDKSSSSFQTSLFKISSDIFTSMPWSLEWSGLPAIFLYIFLISLCHYALFIIFLVKMFTLAETPKMHLIDLCDCTRNHVPLTCYLSKDFVVHVSCVANSRTQINEMDAFCVFLQFYTYTIECCCCNCYVTC